MCSSCHGEPNHGWCAICEENQAATVGRIIGREQGATSVYTPTTEYIRDSYAADIAHVGAYVEKVGAFDRWLVLYRESVIDEVEDHLVRRDQFTERTLDVIDELRKADEA